MAKESWGVEHDDPYELNRFVSAQEGVYDRALAELWDGLKRSHWMWFIFPQIDGLGHSPTTRLYAIKSLDEARSYLGHPVLGARLLECAEALLAVSEGHWGQVYNVRLHSFCVLWSLLSSAYNMETVHNCIVAFSDRNSARAFSVSGCPKAVGYFEMMFISPCCHLAFSSDHFVFMTS